MGGQEADRDSSQGERMCTHHLSCSVALLDAARKSEIQMVRKAEETQLLFMATALFCDGRQTF